MQVVDVLRYWVQEYHVDGFHLVGFAPVSLLGSDPYLSRVKLFYPPGMEFRGENTVIWLSIMTIFKTKCAAF